jgi:hypothetical protein
MLGSLSWWLLVVVLLAGMEFFPADQNLLPVEEDVVLIRRPGSDQVLQRRGEIVDWRGDSLTLQMGDQLRKIPNEEIVGIQTRWPYDYQLGLDALAINDFSMALPLLSVAMDGEPRPWAKLIMRAELVKAFAGADRWDNAILHFRLICEQDPQTRFFHLCPLKWIASANASPQVRIGLMESSDSLKQLIGASWSLIGGEQQQATDILEKLTQDLDPRIQKLAAIQLWRIRALNLGTINQRQLEVWEQRIEELPVPLRAGPYYLLAEIQMKKGEVNPAAVNWMRIPILYPEQISLSAAALYQTSVLLENNQQPEKAQALREELERVYPQTIWVQPRQ